MKIWLIKMLYNSLSPYQRWNCQKYLEQPTLDDVLSDMDERINKNWMESKTYRMSDHDACNKK